MELGLQQETQWLSIKGISYDPNNNILKVSAEELDHMILHPIEIDVGEEICGWLTNIEIKGITNIIEIR